MLQVYLPVAEISVNLLVMLGLGLAIGFLLGVFGVGSFLLTPLLMFLGISPTIAVAASANQVVALSVSAGLVQWRRDNIDSKWASCLSLGGIVGAVAGVLLIGHRAPSPASSNSLRGVERPAFDHLAHIGDPPYAERIFIGDEAERLD